VGQNGIAGELVRGRNEGAKGATLHGAAVGGADGRTARIAREVAPAPMPLVRDQGARSLQDLGPKGLRHGNSPFGQLLAGFCLDCG
jgi:hypothetical protein